MSDTPETDPPPPQSGSAPDRERAAPPGDPDPEGPVDEPAAREEPSGPAGPGQAGTAAGTPRRTKLLLEAAAGALVLALVAGGVAGGRVLGWWGATAGPAPAPTSTPTPAGSPMASPFAGTPAEDFAEGAAGIVLPAAEAVGDFTAEEVSEALEQVRRALIAARLDETMLIDHNPDEFLSLLAPDQQATVRAAFESGDFGRFATQVLVQTVLAVPRVSGRITYATAVDGGISVLEVSTDFVWVYALETDDGPSLAAVKDRLVWLVRDDRWTDSSQGTWLRTATVTVFGADCDSFARGLLEGELGVTAEDMVTFLDSDQPRDLDGTC